MIDGAVSGWEMEGDLKRKREIERERRGSETDVPKFYPTMNMNSLWYRIRNLWFKKTLEDLIGQMLRGYGYLK